MVERIPRLPTSACITSTTIISRLKRESIEFSFATSSSTTDRELPI